MLRTFRCRPDTAATLATASRARAGAYHVGYTRVSPYGVQHYGRTAGVGPTGRNGGRYGCRCLRWLSCGYSLYDRYGGAYGGAYRYGAVGYGAYDPLRGGVYRGW